MGPIKQFDKATATAFYKAAVEALKPLAEATDTVADPAPRIKYDAQGITLTLTYDMKGAAEAEFKEYAKLFGLQPTDFGRTFTQGGVVYRIAGLEPRRPKYPVNAIEVRTGKLFKFTTETVLSRLLGGA